MAFEGEISGRRLGTALREARAAAGLSRREAAERARCSARDLRAIERGDATPDDALLERLAEAYLGQPGDLIPARSEPPVALEDRRLRVGSTTKPLRSETPPTDEVLQSYLGVLYELRDSKPGTPLPLRERDLHALAAALGSEPEVVETRLVELMDVTREEAAAMRATLFRRRVLVPAATIALGAGVIAGGASLANDAGTRRSAAPSVQADDSRSVSIGTAASVTLPNAVEIGDAASASVDRSFEIAGVEIAGVEIGDAASVSRETPPARS